MRVILTEDVPKLGDAGQVVRVRRGYGRNYLIPQGKAMLATERKIAEIEHQRRVIEDKVSKEVAGYKQSAGALAKVELSFEMQSNAEGKLFGSVTNADIQAKLSEAGFKLDRRKIGLAQPIKSVGSHELVVRLHREVQVPMVVTVVSSGEPAPEREPEEVELGTAEQAMIDAEARAGEEY